MGYVPSVLVDIDGIVEKDRNDQMYVPSVLVGTDETIVRDLTEYRHLSSVAVGTDSLIAEGVSAVCVSTVGGDSANVAMDAQADVGINNDVVVKNFKVDSIASCHPDVGGGEKVSMCGGSGDRTMNRATTIEAPDKSKIAVAGGSAFRKC